MRRALGLVDGEPAGDGSVSSRPGEQSRPSSRPVIQRREADRRTRRFVKDGEVPVVVLNSREQGTDVGAPVNRLAAAESALEAERATRERAERSLNEALTTIQHLQTQIAHGNLAQAEALASERQAREAAEQALEEARQTLAAAIVVRDALKRELQEARASTPDTPQAPGIAQAPGITQAPGAAPAPGSAPARLARRRTPRKAEAEDREPQPVKWWLPSYRNKKRRT